MNILGLILDVTVIAMLAATIAYAIRLNRRLSTLRESKAELEMLVDSFAQATARAEAGVENMRRMAGETAQTLQATVDKGQALRDELQFMVEAADSLATRLESAIGGRTSAGPARAEPAAQPSPSRPLAAERPVEAPARGLTEPAPRPEARSRAERELMQALENLR